MLGVLACTDRHDEGVAGAPSAVELSGREQRVFTLMTSGLTERTFAARSREWAAMATGSLHSPFVSSGAPWLASNGTRLRGSCGVTFVAPSYAVTAAHCVNANADDLGALEVEMYRPTAALETGYLEATTLSGTFPDYVHGRLGPEQGYFVDRYDCTVAARCGDNYGPAIGCDALVSAQADVAVLHCAGAPGNKYGYLDVAESDDMSAEVFMPWKHEVYDVEVYAPTTAEQTDQYEHYVALTSQDANYHYLGKNEAGVDQNQLLPLASVPFDVSMPRMKLSGSEYNVTTNLWGCHGTSGSGALQQSGVGLWQLLGPARYGESELGAYLCIHSPAVNGAAREYSSAGISYAGLSGTRHLYSRLSSDLMEDCAPVPAGEGAVLLNLSCPKEALLAHPATADFAGRLLDAVPSSATDYAAAQAVSIAGGQSTSLVGFSVAAQRLYRLGLAVACPGSPCPELRAELDGTTVLSVSGASMTASRQPAASLVTPATSGAVSLELVAVGDGGLEVSDISFQADDQPNSFDSMSERWEARLQDMTAASEPTPARFVGDGRDGFAVELQSDERLALVYQALPAGQRWHLDFELGTAAALDCGLVDASGQVRAVRDCSAPPVVLDDSASTEAPGAVFIQTSPESGTVTVDEVLVSWTEAETGGSGGAGDTGEAGAGGASGALNQGGAAGVSAGAGPTGGGDIGQSGASGRSSQGGTVQVGGAAGEAGRGQAGGGAGAGAIGGHAGEPSPLGGAAGAPVLAGGTDSGAGGSVSEEDGGPGPSAATGGSVQAVDAGPEASGASSESLAGLGGADGQGFGLSGSDAGASEPPVSDGDDSACGCRSAGGDGRRWDGVFGWVLVVGLLVRRKLRPELRGLAE
jgi:MYXO-CTERM domain-containing protein